MCLFLDLITSSHFHANGVKITSLYYSDIHYNLKKMKMNHPTTTPALPLQSVCTGRIFPFAY